MPDLGAVPEPPGRMNPLQEAAAEAGFFTTEHHFLLNFPTGAGKTWMVGELAAQAVAAGRSCVISVPLRALAVELADLLQERLPRGTVALCTGAGRRGRPWRTGALTIATHESFFLQMRLSGLAYLSTLAFAAIDEIHLLEQPGRGALLETLLVRLFRLAPFCRIIALSATLEDGDPRLCGWLEAACVRGNYRPVPLGLVTLPYEAGRREERLMELLRPDSRTTLVFVHSRRRAALLVERLGKAGVPAAVHHAGLSVKRQAQVVRALHDGAVRVVVATPTLEMGLNLPVDRVICPELVFPGSGARRWERISARTLHQRLGRAGRPGLGVLGEGVVLVRAGSADPLAEPFLPVRSQLAGELDAFVLRELGAGLSVSRPQLERALALTFASYCGEPLPLEDALDRLRELELVEWTPEPGIGAVPVLRRSAGPPGKMNRITLTPLGRAAAWQFGPVTRFAGACGLLRRALTTFDLLWLAHACVVQDAYFTTAELERLSDELTGVPSALLTAPGAFERRIGVSPRQATVAACAVAALLAWRGVPKQRREDHVFWGVSFEACRLRAWHALRVLLAWRRLLHRAPEVPVHEDTRAALETAAAFLAFRGPPLSLGELEPAAPRWFPQLGDPDLGDADEPRLRRARQCTVMPCDDGAFEVTHRGAPHRVRDGACDCPDFAPDRPCKHVLAVRLRTLVSPAGAAESPVGAPFHPVAWWQDVRETEEISRSQHSDIHTSP